MENALNFLIVLYFFTMVAIILFYQKAQDWKEKYYEAQKEKEYWRGVATAKKERSAYEQKNN